MRSSVHLRKSRRRGVELGLWCWLVEVPVQGHPHHHRDLSRWAGGRLELGTGGDVDAGDEDSVVLESWLAKGVCASLGRGAAILVLVAVAHMRVARLHVPLDVVIVILLGTEDDRPPDWDVAVSRGPFMALEGETSEDRRDRKDLAIR